MTELLLLFVLSSIFRLCLNEKIRLTSPVNGTRWNGLNQLSILFDCEVDQESTAYFLCIGLDEDAYNCGDLATFWPKSTQELALASLLPGSRSIVIKLKLKQTDQFVASSHVDFTVYHPDQEIEVDLLNLKSISGAESATDRRKVFNEVFRTKFWSHSHDPSSPLLPESGIGSSIGGAHHITRALNEIISAFNIHSVFDVPCGDLTWIPYVHDGFSGMEYYGGDISSLVIDHNLKTLNQLTQTNENDVTAELKPLKNMLMKAKHMGLVTFDIVSESLSELFVEGNMKIDLLFCRHMMIHLRPEDNIKVLENIEQSGIKYLMATTYLTTSNRNNETFNLLLGHHINLMLSPYCLKSPIRLYYDEITSITGGIMYMGLWDLTDGIPLRNTSSVYCNKD